MLPRLLTLSVLLLALSRTAHCYGDDDEGYGGGGDEGYGGGDEDGYGGGDEGGGEAPPAAGDAKELLTVDDFDAFLDDNDASVVGAFTSKDMPDPNAVKPEGWDDDEDGEWSPEVIQNPSLTAFNAITTETYGYRWAYTSAPDVLAKLKAKSDGSLFLYKSPRFLSKEHGDRPRERFPSATLTQSAVSNWLASKSQPLVGLFNSDTKERYVGRYGGAGGAKPAALVVFMNLDFEKNSKSVQYVLKRARKVAAARKGKISVAIASLDDQRYSLDDYGLAASKSSADILMGILHRTPSKDDYYGATDGTAFSEKALAAFADAFLAGELEPHVKPDPPESDYPSEPSEEDKGYGDVDDEEGGGYGGSEGDEDKEEM